MRLKQFMCTHTYGREVCAGSVRGPWLWLGCGCLSRVTTSQRRGRLRRNKPADHAAKAEVRDEYLVLQLGTCERRRVVGA